MRRRSGGCYCPDPADPAPGDGARLEDVFGLVGAGGGARVCVRTRLHVIENLYNNNYNITHFK